MADETSKFQLHSTVLLKTNDNMNQPGIVRFIGEVYKFWHFI